MELLLDVIELAGENGLPPLEEFEEDMKLREDDKNEIYQEIRKIVREALADEIVPLVDRRFAELAKSPRFKLLPILRNATYITTIVLAFIAVVGIALVEHSNSTTRFGDQKQFEGDTNRHLSNIDDKLADIKSDLRSSKLTELGKQPLTPESTRQIASIIDDAKRDKVKLRSSVVTDVGLRLVEASYHPDTWTALNSVLSYKTYLNDAPPEETAMVVAAGANVVLSNPPPGYDGKMLWEGPATPHFAHIGYFDLPPYTPTKGDVGPTIIKMIGGTLHLDGLKLNNVTIYHATIAYSGGPYQLANVVFKDCKFEMKYTEPSNKLAGVLLAENSVTTAIR